MGLWQCFVQIWEDAEDDTNNTYTVKELYKLWPNVRFYR